MTTMTATTLTSFQLDYPEHHRRVVDVEGVVLGDVAVEHEAGAAVCLAPGEVGADD